jgi:hypothetical protein
MGISKRPALLDGKWRSDCPEPIGVSQETQLSSERFPQNVLQTCLLLVCSKGKYEFERILKTKKNDRILRK